MGWNNNPNALQFKWALRALLQKNQVTALQRANCSVVESKLAEEADHIDNKVAALLNSSTIWHEDVLMYIGGYIVKKVTGCIKCAERATALITEEDTQPSQIQSDYSYSLPSSSKSSLTSFKTYGKLISPSSSVLNVVKQADKSLRNMVVKWSQLTDKSIPVVQRDVLQEVKPTVFKSLEQHSQETHVLGENRQDDHITTIIKKITFLYTKIFRHQYSKVYTERIVRQGAPSKRQKLNKLILFGKD